MSEAILEPAFAVRLGELRHQGRGRHEQHRVAGQDRLAPDRYRQMRFAYPRQNSVILPSVRLLRF
jgi:hypothetical protein